MFWQLLSVAVSGEPKVNSVCACVVAAVVFAVIHGECGRMMWVCGIDVIR